MERASDLFCFFGDFYNSVFLAPRFDHPPHLASRPKWGDMRCTLLTLMTFLALLAKVGAAAIVVFFTLFGLIPWLIAKILRW
ncbi:hypothetical protein [Hyphomicrobium sp. 2TAF46]|uniref:hypothetical protein n=1 Tax=Hyphomicrobium sp. 2TAF46 TaxID=3233019 RepID=UPI003F9294E0